jgi:Starch-binding module 26/Chitobiase/beta-hexosaminidase C-terminal domain
VTASPDAGNYPSYPINVSLTGISPKMPVVLYYTTDGSTPTTSSAVYSSAINLGVGGVAKTLKVLAIDNLGQTSVTTFNYTFEAIPDITVYFKRPTNWGTNVKIHYWNGVPTGVYAPTNWSGVAMMPVCGDWYSFKFSGITNTNLIFNDGVGNQTADLNRSLSGYYDNGWLTTTPTISGDPSVLAAPAGPLTSGSAISVTLTGTACSGNATIYYTTDGSTPTTASPSAINGTNLNITQTTTLKFFVIDGTGATSAIQTHVYTITSLKDITIYFKKPTAWTSVKIHYFNVLPNTNYPNTTWSGVAMTDDGGGWFKFTFSQILSTNFVINGNSSPQTADLFRNNTGWYDYTVTPAVWYNSDPRVIPIELVDFIGKYDKNKQKVALNWQTASEINNAGFDIERSLNGSDFNKIGFVKGFGTTRTPQYYSYFDAYFSENTINYYRLKQIDTDNKTAYSKTIALATQSDKTLKIYPTIVENGVLNVIFDGYTEGSYFSIVNLMGQQIMSGKTSNSIDISALPQGVFILKIGALQAKFIKL